MVSTLCASKPGPTSWRAMNVRIRSAAPINSTRASEISLTTSSERAFPSRNPVPERLPLSLSVEFTSEREALKAGSSPKRMPVSNETPRVKPSTRQSMPMAEPFSPMRGRPAGLTASSARMPTKPRAMPRMPPARESNTLSVSNWRTMRARPGSQRGPDRELAFADRGAHQQQIGDIGAGRSAAPALPRPASSAANCARRR